MPHLEPEKASQPRPLTRVRSIARGACRGLLLAIVAIVVLRLSGCMESLFFHPTAGPTPPPLRPPGIEHIRFNSGDGLVLSGWFIPAQPGDEPSPTILHVHGNAGSIKDHAWFTQHLPPAGFNVFIFDYRGYGESEGSARNRADLTADTHAALDAILDREDVDPSRIGLFGQSLGGAIGLQVVADREEIACAVIVSPFASWRDVAANAVGGDPPNLIGRLLALTFIPDHSRPLDAIASIDRPVLILHGDADCIVPVSHAHRLMDAAQEDVASLTILPGGAHNTLRETHPDSDELCIEFLRRHLPHTP